MILTEKDKCRTLYNRLIVQISISINNLLDKIQLGETLNPLNDVSAVSSIGNTSNLKDVFGKVDKLGDLWDKGQADASLIRCIPGLSNVSRQGKIFNIAPKKAYATSTYTDKKHWSLQLS